MKNIVVLICLLVSFNSYSQTIDSINVLNQNTPPEIHVFGKLYHTGYSITDVNYEVSNSIFLTIFFKECNGYQVVTPFDTVLSVTESWPVVPNEIITISILDTNTTDPNCFIVNQYDTLEINTFSPSILSVDNLVQLEKIKIFPCPIKNVLQVEVLNEVQIEKIELLDISSKQVKTFNNTDRHLNISGLSSGIYLLRISTNEDVVTKKVVIE